MKFNSRKSSTWIVIGLASVFTFILILQFMEDPDIEYEKNLTEARTDKNKYFATDEESPLPDSIKSSFRGLNYFPPDRSFRVTADFIPSNEYELFQIEMKGGEPEVYILAGTVEFELKGQRYALTAFNRQGGSTKSLFIPFRDGTSGSSTYGGGRYLEARLTIDKVRLDFNTCYNPYCVYDISYICPIPPETNTMKIAVEAGEKKFEAFKPGGN